MTSAVHRHLQGVHSPQGLGPLRFSLNLSSSTHVLTTGTRIAALHLDNFTAEFQSKPSFLLAKLRKAENARPKSRTISSVTHVQGTLFSFKPSVEVLLVITLPTPSYGRWRKDCDTPIAKPHRRCMAAFLVTLPIGEFSNRLAEVLKTAVIWNEDDFALLESCSQETFETIQTPSRTTPGGPPRLVQRAKRFFPILSLAALLSNPTSERDTGLRNLVSFAIQLATPLKLFLLPRSFMKNVSVLAAFSKQKSPGN
ncbi:hypothetical protein M422DRAFT_257711 [Sphaerobolus stellatus SS14]|uniref:Uncharacterized protein n=1 Tax=Sphaerobolus stellatus (strain SS14) TaxID=990650 RepID=A0A0C9UX29_SPHS4|nr:hypothetical protein M422DRAFT_257711 [Sphaerobolus stellatus SS14]